MKTPPKPTFKQKLWLSLESFLLILLRDIILFLIVWAALVVGFIGVVALKALGMSTERTGVLETIHFYSYLTVAVIFLLDMVVKIVLEIFKKQP
jgi:fumarate reductase subunit C